jgi:hypothetical protein
MNEVKNPLLRRGVLCRAVQYSRVHCSTVQYSTLHYRRADGKVPLPMAAVDGLSARIFLSPAMFVIILKKSRRQSHKAVSRRRKGKKK